MRTKKATTRNLLPHHLKLIKGSGIKDEVAEARGYRSITKPATLSRLGFSEKQAALVPALLHPIWDVFGENTRAQSRPDNPRLRDEKPIRYENVPKMGVALDVNPLARERVLAPRDDLFITEGIRKGDSLASRGLAAIALLGVWNWRGTDKSGALTALADWEKVSLKGRTVNIIFDSDVITKPSVKLALERLKRFLERRGAKVRLIYLPSGKNGGKQGIDDWFASGGTVKKLVSLAEDRIREDDEIRLMSEVKIRPVKWLWELRVPRGKITALIGDPDRGKSLITTDLIARVTRGSPMPDGTSTNGSGSALIICAEDDMEDTIKPRLAAAGARMDRVGWFPLKKNDEGRVIPLRIPEDLARIERMIKLLRNKTHLPVKLLVIDPIHAYLSEKISYGNDPQVRTAMLPLKQVAEETKAAIILVIHLNKEGSARAMYRAGGSIVFVAAARSVLVVEHHPDQRDSFVLGRVKLNVAVPTKPSPIGSALIRSSTRRRSSGASYSTWTWTS